MVTGDMLGALYGDPSKNTNAWAEVNMHVWRIPDAIRKRIPELPGRIYMHKDFSPIVESWLAGLIVAHVADEINTFDGCWNVRPMRGLKQLSIHSWGMAIDFNAAHNPLGMTTKQAHLKGLTPFTQKFFDVSRNYVDCGIDWPRRPDGMHFQIKVKDL